MLQAPVPPDGQLRRSHLTPQAPQLNGSLWTLVHSAWKGSPGKVQAVCWGGRQVLQAPASQT